MSTVKRSFCSLPEVASRGASSRDTFLAMGKFKVGRFIGKVMSVAVPLVRVVTATTPIGALMQASLAVIQVAKIKNSHLALLVLNFAAPGLNSGMLSQRLAASVPGLVGTFNPRAGAALQLLLQGPNQSQSFLQVAESAAENAAQLMILVDQRELAAVLGNISAAAGGYCEVTELLNIPDMFAGIMQANPSDLTMDLIFGAPHSGPGFAPEHRGPVFPDRPSFAGPAQHELLGGPVSGEVGRVPTFDSRDNIAGSQGIFAPRQPLIGRSHLPNESLAHGTWSPVPDLMRLQGGNFVEPRPHLQTSSSLTHRCPNSVGEYTEYMGPILPDPRLAAQHGSEFMASPVQNVERRAQQMHQVPERAGVPRRAQVLGGDATVERAYWLRSKLKQVIPRVGYLSHGALLLQSRTADGRMHYHVLEYMEDGKVYCVPLPSGVHPLSVKVEPYNDWAPHWPAGVAYEKQRHGWSITEANRTSVTGLKERMEFLMSARRYDILEWNCHMAAHRILQSLGIDVPETYEKFWQGILAGFHTMGRADCLFGD